MRTQWVAIVLGLTLVVAATAAAPAASEPQSVAGKLGFRLTLRQSGPINFPCPGSLRSAVCVQFTGRESVRGLGNVSVTYDRLIGVGPPACRAGFAKPLPTTGFLSVARKGHIDFTVAKGARCVPYKYGSGDWYYEPQEFTITGGTGPFAAAHGRGKIRRPFPDAGLEKTEHWTGTLEVPGRKFDMTAPKLHGVGSKTVRAPNGAKSARVTPSR